MFPQLPSDGGWQQYAGAAQDFAGAAQDARQAKKKKQQGQMGAQPGMPDLMRDLGAAGLGPQATPFGGGGGGLMSWLGHAFSSLGIGYTGGQR